MTRQMIAHDWIGGAGLQSRDVNLPQPAPHEVRISVRAAAVNPIDVKRLRGTFARDASALPLRPGVEVAGVVTAVGIEAVGRDGFVQVGDEVVAYPVVGGFADDVLVESAAVWTKPAQLTWEEAAGLLLAGTTAVHMLAATQVSAGDTVVVHGASGAVGLTAVQLAVAAGARVVGTASRANLDVLRDFGAEPVAYGPGLLRRLQNVLPDGADVALDVAGTQEALDSSIVLVSDRSRIATVVNFTRGDVLGIQLLGGRPGADPGTAIRRAATPALLEAAASGRLTIRISRRFALEDAPAAIELVESEHPGGKVILVP